ncbi:hypothetical protein MHYP_G00044690 [Metynnis hypsauchen]
MDELYEEYCVTLPCQQEIVERKAPVVEKWVILLKSTKTPNLTAVASFLFSIPITNASVERVFSLMTAAWTDQRNHCSVELIKSEIQVKTNSEYSCKEFYSFALKQKALLKLHAQAKSMKASGTSKAYVVPDQKASTVVRVLTEKWFYVYGVPKRILSDQRRNFEGEFLKRLCKIYGIEKSQTTPYHPEDSRQCEHCN